MDDHSADPQATSKTFFGGVSSMKGEQNGAPCTRIIINVRSVCRCSSTRSTGRGYGLVGSRRKRLPWRRTNGGEGVGMWSPDVSRGELLELVVRNLSRAVEEEPSEAVACRRGSLTTNVAPTPRCLGGLAASRAGSASLGDNAATDLLAGRTMAFGSPTAWLSCLSVGINEAFLRLSRFSLHSIRGAIFLRDSCSMACHEHLASHQHEPLRTNWLSPVFGRGPKLNEATGGS